MPPVNRGQLTQQTVPFIWLGFSVAAWQCHAILQTIPLSTDLYIALYMAIGPLLLHSF